MKGAKLTVLLLLICSLSYSQRWKRERVELIGMLGATNFLGDLGGSNLEGTNGLRDFDLQSTRFAIGAGYRYFIKENMAAKGNLLYARISGNDKFSKNEVRKARGLKFRSPIIELSAQFEYYFLQEKSKGMYRLRGVKGLKALKFDAYAFLGVGAFWFNPRGEYEGKWYSLQPLATEGQGIREGLSKYKRVQMTYFPGIGLKKKIDRKWSIGMEMTMRLTTSDYLDDVSGQYWINDEIRANTGDAAAFLANPPGTDNFLDVGFNPDGTPALREDGTIGEDRGDPGDNDSYMFLMFSANYKFSKRRRSLPKF